MGVKVSGTTADTAGNTLREGFIEFMQRIDMPNGLHAVGYTSADIETLATGTLRQTRLISLSPEPVTRKAVEQILERSLVVW